MISGINFLGQITPKYDLQAQKPALKPMECDCFVKSTPETDKKEEAIQKAKEKIIQEIKDNNIEYGFTISPEGEILAQNRGDEHSCSVDSRKIVPQAILLHGHPVALPLSSRDIAVLIATPAKTQEAIMQDGKFSRMSKRNPDNGTGDYRQIYYNLEKQLNLMALEQLGIDYRLNMGDIIKMGKDHIQYSTMRDMEDADDDTIIEELNKLGIDTQQPPEQIANDLKELMFYQLLTNPQKYDKEHNSIMDNYDSIQELLNSDEGKVLRHKFAQKIADKYDLEYQTDLF